MGKNSIENCQFNGVVWDGQAIEAVNSVAKALLNLTQIFQSQNITIKSLVDISGDEMEIKGKTPDSK